MLSPQQIAVVFTGSASNSPIFMVRSIAALLVGHGHQAAVEHDFGVFLRSGAITS